MRIDCGRVAWALSSTLLGCGVGPPQYSGVTRPQVVSPASVSVVAEKTRGFSALGSVRASCSRPVPRGPRAAVEATLADFMCSRELLEQALEEQAALVGGSALTRLECTDAAPTLRCRARVLAASSGVSDWPGPSWQGDPQAAQAWQIQVVFEPTRAALVRWDAAQLPRTGDQVELLHYVRPNELLLGDLEARCAGCRAEEVVHAIRRVAGRLGGRSLVGLRCSRLQGEGERCRAELSALEVRAAAF